MEPQGNNKHSIQTILNNYSDRIEALTKEIENIETPTRNNLELQPPGHSGNRYSIHLEEKKANLRNEIENTKSEARTAILQLIEDRSHANTILQVDRKQAEQLRPLNYNNEAKDLSESQESVEQQKLESKMKVVADRNEIVKEDDAKFLKRFGQFLDNKSEITKEKHDIEPDLD